MISCWACVWQRIGGKLEGEGEAQPGLQLALMQRAGGDPRGNEGDCVSYAWRATAREIRPRRSDPHAHRPIWVLP